MREAGFIVDQAGEGQSGMGMATSESCNCAIVDIMLLGIDGLSIIERMLGNLLENALKYTRPKGKEIYIKVADTGMDIQTSEQPRVLIATTVVISAALNWVGGS